MCFNFHTGHETKALLNNSGIRAKRSQLERDINKDIISQVILLFVLCLIGAICELRTCVHGHTVRVGRMTNDGSECKFTCQINNMYLNMCMYMYIFKLNVCYDNNTYMFLSAQHHFVIMHTFNMMCCFNHYSKWYLDGSVLQQEHSILPIFK